MSYSSSYKVEVHSKYFLSAVNLFLSLHLALFQVAKVFALGELIVAYYSSELDMEVIAILLLCSILVFTYNLLSLVRVPR